MEDGKMNLKTIKGLVFDIKQFALFDGPGIRTTVFLKGCPMRCQWCHNPEGLNFKPQLKVNDHIKKIIGTYYTVSELAAILLHDKDFLEMNQGGITLSGGEPLAQPEFTYKLLGNLPEIHTAIETSGYSDEDVFQRIISRIDYVMMDIKMVDRELHWKYTGVDNQKIMRNLAYLKKCGKEFVIRIPLIPGVNDMEENLIQTALLLKEAENLIKVELLPYHKTAGAKYRMVGKVYAPDFDEKVSPNCDIGIFRSFGIPCEVL